MTSTYATINDIERDWQIIVATATMVIALCSNQIITLAGDDQLEEVHFADREDEEEEGEHPVKPVTMKMPLVDTIVYLDGQSRPHVGRL